MNIDNLKRILRALEQRGYIKNPRRALLCLDGGYYYKNHAAAILFGLLCEELGEERPFLVEDLECRLKRCRQVKDNDNGNVDIPRIIAIIAIAQELATPIEDVRPPCKRIAKKE